MKIKRLYEVWPFLAITLQADYYQTARVKAGNAYAGLAVYFCRPLTPEQQAAILAAMPRASFMVARSQYAPEQVKPVLFIPKVPL